MFIVVFYYFEYATVPKTLYYVHSYCFKIQELLRSLSFSNTAEEFSSLTRTIVVTVFQPMENRTCEIAIDIALVNDHIPMVDLNGPEQPLQSYSTALTYNYLSPNSVNIASSDAQIVDLDTESIISFLELEVIVGQEGDQILFDTNLCPLPVSTEVTTCYLR